jgi:two-component system phosphate regulon sensor histidine kinase PhoR
MSDMLTDLLDVYRLEAGRLALDVRPVALHPLAEQACVQVAPAVAGKRLTLHNAIAPDLPPVQGDGDKLGRVLANLLMNAFKYTAQGAITLSAEVGDDNGHPYAPPGEGQPPVPGRRYAVVSVQDTGVGIPAAVRARIFSKFDRGADGGGGSAIRGAGLGLYFARQMVEAHGGNIWVEPAPAEGSGSVFRFSVPLPES